MNTDNNKILKNDAQLAGRIPQQYKDFIDSLYKDEEGNIKNGESFPNAIRKLIDAYRAKPLEQSEFNFNEDLNNIKNAASLISNAILGLQAKTELYVKSQIEDANNKIEEKNTILKEAEEQYNEVILEVKEENNTLKMRVEELNNELISVKGTLAENTIEITDLNEVINHKEDIITSLVLDKNKLSAETTNAIEENVKLKNKINDLHAIETENIELKHRIEQLTEINRDNEAKISNLSLNIKELSSFNERKEKENEEMRKEISGLKDLINNKELEHQKELLSLERSLEKEFKLIMESEIEKIKNKYEAEIKELVKKNYKLEAQLEK